MKFRPLVEVRVFFDRMGLILSAIPHLWRYYPDWDESYPLATLRWRLARLERVIRADTVHEGVDEQADDIKRFLKLLDDHENALERVPRTPAVEEWFDEPWHKEPGSLTVLKDGGPDVRAYIEAVETFRENAWNEAWNLFRDKSRNWWV